MSPIPHYFLRVHGSQEMMHTIADMVKRDRYDAVIAEYSVMGQFIHNNSLLPSVRRIISVHECYYLARLQSYKHYGLGINKLKEAIRIYNKSRELALKVNKLRQAVPSPMRGSEALGYLYLTGMSLGSIQGQKIYKMK